MRIVLYLNFKGTAYAGWQRQKNAVSVQQVVEDALTKITGARAVLHAAGRTDAGVHAYSLPAHFDTDFPMPLERYRQVLNTVLPPDISINGVSLAPEGFHAQYSVTERVYEYKILLTDARRALFFDTHWQMPPPLNTALMREAAADILGARDFRAFSGAGGTPASSVRTLNGLSVDENGAEIILTVRANGFLYNMVRIITAQLVKVGKEQMPPAALLAKLRSGDRANARECAPACGLYFVKAAY
jgi:tRNA pseudouridine38-40 synthase